MGKELGIITSDDPEQAKQQEKLECKGVGIDSRRKEIEILVHKTLWTD